METHGNMGKEELRLDFSKPEAFMPREGKQGKQAPVIRQERKRDPSGRVVRVREAA
jgi:hypothetical protein